VSRRRSLALTAAAVAVLAACGGAPTDYGNASEEVFMRSCTAGGGGDLEDVCRCSYDRIVAEIPYEDFKRYDEQLQKDQADIPDALVTIISACAAGNDATTTTTEG
jgi:hypothetical protein